MAQTILHIDLETYSSEDIKSAGAYRYLASHDFEILLLAYAVDDRPVIVIDFTKSEKIPSEFCTLMRDPNVLKVAHNAVFERKALERYGFNTEIPEWEDTAIMAARQGLPLSLAGVSEALNLGEKAKKSTGKALIKKFCCPRKPTKNDARTRVMPSDSPEEWTQFKIYNKYDVEAEREIYNLLNKYSTPECERRWWILDQQINDRGIKLDTDMARHIIQVDSKSKEFMLNRIKELTGLNNPNSGAQLKKWIKSQTGEEVKSLTKDTIPQLIKNAESPELKEVLTLKAMVSKSSVTKYQAMLKCVCPDGRAHGLFQYYGANRTGRWAGRLIQLQNLPRNYIEPLDEVREQAKTLEYEDLELMYGNVPDVLSQLIRTALIADEGKTFCVADFSAIEARVIAWLSNEEWKLEVFRTHGKIYEASAAMMFNVPIEQVTKGSDLRAKGKISELALGYGGGVPAMRAMGGDKLEQSDAELQDIIRLWRKKNSGITGMWAGFEKAAKRAIKTHKLVRTPYKGIAFQANRECLKVKLPSGRCLTYREPGFCLNRFGNESIKFMGKDSTGKWAEIETYGGKLTENIVQAVARDLLADAMCTLDRNGFEIVMHVHDENIAPVPIAEAEQRLEQMCALMGQTPDWAKGLPLNADGYITPFYKKD